MSEPATTETMSEELFDLFCDAIETFPEDHLEAARQWFAEASAALHIVRNLQKGIMP
jgi:hypothetical protein